MSQRFNRDRVQSLGRYLWRRFLDDKCFETAGALSYTTLVSLVPLMVAGLAMFSVFPVFAGARDTLLNYVFKNFVPAAGEHVQTALQAFASNASQLTGISILLMLFSAISMMVSIEDRLNRIWRVSCPRRWGSRLLLYWAALTLGPILVVGGLVASSYVTALPLLHETVSQLGIGGMVLRILPFAATFVTLWLLYAVVPNRRVPYREASIGALLGAILFEVARWGFRLFVQSGHTYQQIYGKALAVLPIFLLWIYLSWVIVILGASIAASIASFEYRPAAKALPRDAEFLGLLTVLWHFVAAQRAGRSTDPAQVQLIEPGLHGTNVVACFDVLQRAGLIQRSESGGWLLSRSLDGVDLLHVYNYCDYRLPLEPAKEAAALELDLPAPLLALLEELAQTLRETLGARLDQAYPAGCSPHSVEESV
ncbi:YihY family inner membrane protein [Dyella sp. A6]|uniref:YihY family inner membrane protein n=1 Tax=Dyella aluminiiresistens TaxID=3069105 RepID=UPI002E777125|nr:YihY family inner membrane protein [Dyella sp. A6]